MSDVSYNEDFITQNMGLRPLTPEELGQIDPEALAAAGTVGSVQAVQPVYAPKGDGTRVDTSTLFEDGGGAGDDTTTPFNEDAYAKLNRLLDQYKIGGLTSRIRDLIARGITDTEALLFELRDTDEFKNRFIANVARKAKNLPALSPATYVALEQSYRETLKANGLNPDLYDDEKDFRLFLEGDVSPAELQARIESGYRAVTDADPEVVRQMQELYNVSPAQLVQYFLDPQKTTPQLMRQAQAAELSARAKEQGKLQLSAVSAEELVSRGYSESQAAAAFNLLSEQAGLYQEMAGETALTQEEKIGSVFGYSPEGKQKITKRKELRKSPFQGGGGFAKTTGQTSGTIQTGLGVAE